MEFNETERGVVFGGDDVYPYVKTMWPERIAEATILIIIGVVAFSGNILLCSTICRFRHLRTVSNCLILCLCAADILVSLVNVPMTVAAVLYGSWPTTETLCIVIAFTNMVFFIASVMSLGNISINRYMTVCRTTRAKEIYSARNAFLMSLGKQLTPVVGY